MNINDKVRVIRDGHPDMNNLGKIGKVFRISKGRYEVIGVDRKWGAWYDEGDLEPVENDHAER